MTELKDLKNILVLGSGTLGLRVGLACALAGYQVTIYDIDASVFKQAKEIQKRILKRLAEGKLISQQDIDQAISRLHWTTDPTVAASEADLISESITEDVAIKEKVWKQFGQLCPPHTIFTTNTSYLLPSMFAEISGRPERFCAFHFHDVFLANIVDIMPHPGTADWMIPLLKDFGKRIGQTPVVVKKESSGYIFNAMLIAVIGAAGALVTNEIASIEDVDRSWMGNFKMPMGPFGILDEVGLDTAWHIVKVRKDTKSLKFAQLLQTYVEQGKLGKKTGEGFYKYPDPSYQETDFI